MTAPTFESLKDTYARQWAGMQIRPSRLDEFQQTVARLYKGKDQYKAVEAETGVPWWMVAVIHEREAGGSWRGCLANGDPWDRRTVNEPRGYGPWSSWHAAAVWALKFDGLAGKPVDFWTIERALFYCEQFNGWGYYLYHDHMPSPYVWGGTTVQKQGKYVADGKWNANVWDGQLGCAGMLKLLLALDRPGVDGPPVPVPQPAPSPPVVSPVPPPQKAPGTAWIAAFLKFLRGSK